MEKDDTNGHDLAQELEDIQAKLVEIAAAHGDNAPQIKNELMDLVKQTDRLSAQVVGKRSPDKGTVERKTILVVDDNEILREVIDSAFESTDHEVLMAATSEEAMDLFKAADEVHLVIMDIFLPGMNGPALVQRLRELNPEIKVIYMSGYVEENVVSQEVESVLSSGTIFLQKPFSLTDLLKTVEKELAAS